MVQTRRTTNGPQTSTSQQQHVDDNPLLSHKEPSFSFLLLSNKGGLTATMMTVLLLVTRRVKSPNSNWKTKLTIAAWGALEKASTQDWWWWWHICFLHQRCIPSKESWQEHSYSKCSTPRPISRKGLSSREGCSNSDHNTKSPSGAAEGVFFFIESLMLSQRCGPSKI